MALPPSSVGYDRQNVPSTSISTTTMSRYDVLEWVNERARTWYKKVEDLCDGVAYCRLMDILYPGSVPLKSVRTDAKDELDYMHNLKLLQHSLKKMNSYKTVPMEMLCKGRFQHNLEFVQWFIKFFDINYGKTGMRNNLGAESSLVASTTILLEKLSPNTPRPVMTSTPRPVMTSTPRPVMTCAPGSADTFILGSADTFILGSADKSISRSKTELAVAERDFYYKKLRAIEIMCLDQQGSDGEKKLANKILQVAWAL